MLVSQFESVGLSQQGQNGRRSVRQLITGHHSQGAERDDAGAQLASSFLFHSRPRPRSDAAHLQGGNPHLSLPRNLCRHTQRRVS